MVKICAPHGWQTEPNAPPHEGERYTAVQREASVRRTSKSAGRAEPAVDSPAAETHAPTIGFQKSTNEFKYTLSRSEQFSAILRHFNVTNRCTFYQFSTF